MKLQIRSSAAAVVVLGLGLLAGQVAGFTIQDSFENSYDGWTNVVTNPGGGGPPSFAPWMNVTPHSNDGNSPSTLDGTGADGVWQIAPNVSTFSNPCCAQDGLANTLVLTSPTFTLGSTASITFALTGGQGSATSPATGNFNTLPSATSHTGFEGLALRDTATGAYILSQNRGSNAESYSQFTFSNAQLAAANVLGNGTVLQLDLVNNFLGDGTNGGWGWVGLDNVTIAGATPEPGALMLALLGFASIVARTLWKRRAAA